MSEKVIFNISFKKMKLLLLQFEKKIVNTPTHQIFWMDLASKYLPGFFVDIKDKDKQFPISLANTHDILNKEGQEWRIRKRHNSSFQRVIIKNLTNSCGLFKAKALLTSDCTTKLDLTNIFQSLMTKFKSYRIIGGLLYFENLHIICKVAYYQYKVCLNESGKERCQQ